MPRSNLAEVQKRDTPVLRHARHICALEATSTTSPEAAREGAGDGMANERQGHDLGEEEMVNLYATTVERRDKTAGRPRRHVTTAMCWAMASL